MYLRSPAQSMAHDRERADARMLGAGGAGGGAGGAIVVGGAP